MKVTWGGLSNESEKIYGEEEIGQRDKVKS